MNHQNHEPTFMKQQQNHQQSLIQGSHPRAKWTSVVSQLGSLTMEDEYCHVLPGSKNTIDKVGDFPRPCLLCKWIKYDKMDKMDRV